jgi:FKBP-type peptidyl-prolyl cis-trans isomerase
MKFKFFFFLLAAMFMIGGVSCQKSGMGSKAKLTTTADSASYAIGVQLGTNIKTNLSQVPGGDQINVEMLSNAFYSIIKGEEAQLTAEQADAVVRDFFTKIAGNEAQKNLEEGNAFLEKNKTRSGVKTTESGLQYEVIKEGTGPKPTETDQVKVHYHGTLINGTVFDSSVERGEPITFAVNGVIPGWTEALKMMSVGSKWKIYLPSSLAYGERGAGSQIGPNSVLVFEVELLEIPK